MKNYLKLSFMILIVSIIMFGCSNNENKDENENEVLADNTENEENENIGFEDTNDEEEDPSIKLEPTSLDLNEPLDDLKDFYHSLYFIDSEELGMEDELSLISLYVDYKNDKEFTSQIIGYTAEPKTQISVVTVSGENEFESKLEETDADGKDKAEEVIDGLYHYAGKFIWTEEGNSYSMDGGREVVSTNPENNIKPEDDMLKFYHDRVKMKYDIDEDFEKLKNSLVPDLLPEGYDLISLHVERNYRESLSSYPKFLGYTLEDKNANVVKFSYRTDYDKEPTLQEDDVEEIKIDGVDVQKAENEIMFTLGDGTYSIIYNDLNDETIEEIASSLIKKYQP